MQRARAGVLRTVPTLTKEPTTKNEKQKTRKKKTYFTAVAEESQSTINRWETDIPGYMLQLQVTTND